MTRVIALEFSRHSDLASIQTRQVWGFPVIAVRWIEFITNLDSGWSNCPVAKAHWRLALS